MTLSIKTINTAAVNVKLTSFEPPYKEDLVGTQFENDQDEPGNTYIRVSEVNLKSALESLDNDQYRLRIEHPEIAGGEGPTGIYARRNVVDFTTVGVEGTNFVDDQFNAKLQAFPSHAADKGTAPNMKTYKETGSTNVSYLYLDNPLADYINYNNAPHYNIMSDLTTNIATATGPRDWNYATTNNRIGSIISGVSAFGTDVRVRYLPLGDTTLDAIVGVSTATVAQGFIVVEQDITTITGTAELIAAGTPVAYGGLSVGIYKYDDTESSPSEGTRTIYYFRGTSKPTLTSVGASYSVTSPNPVEVGKTCVINGVSVTILESTTGDRQIVAPSPSFEKTKIFFARSSTVKSIRFFTKIPAPTDMVIDIVSEQYSYTSIGTEYSIYPPTTPLKIRLRDTLFDVEAYTALQPVLTDLPVQFYETDGYIVCLIPEKEPTGDFYNLFSNSVNIHDSANLAAAALAAPTLQISPGQTTVNSAPVTELKILFIQHPFFDVNIFFTGAEFLDGGFTGLSLAVNASDIQNAIGTDWNTSKSLTAPSASYDVKTVQSFFNAANPGVPGTSAYYFDIFGGASNQYDPLNLDSVRNKFHGVMFFEYKLQNNDFLDPLTKIIYKESQTRPSTYNLRYDDSRLLAAYPGTNLDSLPGSIKKFTKSGYDGYLNVFTTGTKPDYPIVGNLIIDSSNGLSGTSTGLIDFSFLGDDYTNNDIFYISTGPTDKFYSETTIVPSEPVLIAQFKKRLNPTELTYRCILEYNNGSGWKKVIDSDTAEFSMQYETMSISDGAVSYFNARTHVTEEINFTEATVYTNSVPNVGLTVSILGSIYTIKNVSSLSATLPRLHTSVNNVLTQIDNESLGGLCAIVLVFPEMNVTNTVHSLMDSNTLSTHSNYQRTYKTIVGFGSVTVPTMYYNTVGITAIPDVKFRGAVFNQASSNMLPLPSSSSTILSIVNEFNSRNDTQFSYPSGANPIPDMVLVVPQFRQKQDHVTSSGSAATSYSIKVYLNTGVTKPILHSRQVAGDGNWVDVSFIPGLSSTMPKAIRADSNTGFSNYTISPDQADYVLELGSNHITNIGINGSDFVTVPSNTSGTLYYSPIVSSTTVPVIFATGSTAAAYLYHKSGANPKTLGVGRNMFVSGTLAVDQELSIEALLGEMTLVRSVLCPSDVALSSIVSDTLFTNASFTTLATNYILLIVDPGITTQGTRAERSTGIPATSPVYFATKTIYVEDNTLVALTSVTDTTLTTVNNILVVMNRSLFSSAQNIYTNEKDYNPTSNSNGQQTAVLDDTTPAGDRNYENNKYDAYLYVVSDEPATQSYEFVDDNVLVTSSSGVIDVLQYIKTRRSATVVNREGEFSVQLFKGTPLVIFTGLKWSIGAISAITYNYNNMGDTTLSIDRAIYDRGTIYFKANTTDAYYSTIKLVHYDLPAPTLSGETKELAIIITAGNTIKNLKIVALNVIHENKDVGSEQYRFNL